MHDEPYRRVVVVRRSRGSEREKRNAGAGIAGRVLVACGTAVLGACRLGLLAGVVGTPRALSLSRSA